MFSNNMFLLKKEFKDIKIAPKPASSLVHPDDYAVYDFLNIQKYNGIIAGGCALSWYQNQPVGSKDIDIWFDSQDNYNNMSQYLSGYPFNRLSFQTANAETWECTVNSKEHRVQRIQLIKNFFYTDIQEIINNFDISVCQIATDGTNWYHSDKFCIDLKEKRLRLLKTTPTSLKRLIKYWTYGFQPDENDLQLIINNPNTTWDFTDSTDEEYADAN